MTDSPARFLYIPKVIGKDFKPEHTLHNLEKFTEYSVHIQAYNGKGRGPSSPDYKVFTLEDGKYKSIFYLCFNSWNWLKKIEDQVSQALILTQELARKILL